ncbi:MAG: alpha/beta fold hydrolase [Acidimicrobiaceae bacterium]|nr:alpha/beta fold hydrolase [Acidimicrobiaceae bacterium]
MSEPMLFFEDFTPGDVIELGTCEMTEDEIIDFGRRFDPQYFHTDPQAAADSPFGGLIASGWHTVSAWARLWIDALVAHADGRGSPGMQDVRWLEPVRPGDVLTATVEILDTRPSSRHADRGTVFIACKMTNQHGRVVMTCHGRGLFGRRHPAGERIPSRPEQDAGAGPSATAGSVEVRSADGVKLNLTTMGGSGPDLLVCHATGFHGLAYRPLAQHLAEDFTVWALDFRGHGTSGRAPGDDYAWSGMGIDVAACAAAIGAGRLYGLGHSMGGAALLLAERSQPGTFDRLFLYEPIVLPRGFFDATAANPLAEGARKRREVFNSRAEAIERYASRSPLGVMRADALAAYVEGGFVDMPDGRVRLACSAETEARTFEASGGLPTEEASAISVPATVAAGTVAAGVSNPGIVGPEIAEALPLGRFLGFAGLGHFGPLEAPGVVAAAAVRELLGDQLSR